MLKFNYQAIWFLSILMGTKVFSQDSFPSGNFDKTELECTLNEDFQFCKVAYSSGKSDSLSIKYELINRRIWVLKSNGKIEVNGNIEKVENLRTYQGEVISIQKYKMGPYFPFLQVLHSGKISLLKYHYAELVDKVEYGGTTGKKCSIKSKYFLKNDHAEPVEIKPNKENFIALIPNQSNDLVAYFKDHKVNLKKEKDLLELVYFLNR